MTTLIKYVIPNYHLNTGMMLKYLGDFKIRTHTHFSKLLLLFFITIYALGMTYGFAQNQIKSDSPTLKPLPFSYMLSTFRSDTGKTLLHIALTIPRRELVFQESMFGKGKCPLNIAIELRSLSKIDLQRYNEQIIVWNNSTKTDTKEYVLTEQKITTSPGEYVATIQISTLDNKRFGRQSDTISVPSFSGNSLLLSSIQLAYRIDEPDQNQSNELKPVVKIVAYPLRKIMRNYPLFAFFEIYNLTRDEKGTVSYEINYQVFKQKTSTSVLKRLLKRTEKKPILTNTIKRQSTNQTISDYISLDPAKFDDGNMLLMITVKDGTTNNFTHASIPFEIINNLTGFVP